MGECKRQRAGILLIMGIIKKILVGCGAGLNNIGTAPYQTQQQRPILLIMEYHEH